MPSRNKSWLVGVYFFACVLVGFYVVQLSNKTDTQQHDTIITNIITDEDDANDIPNVAACACSKDVMYPPPQSADDAEEFYRAHSSSCSDEGTWYQSGQNVVSFSLFVEDAENEQGYIEGIMQNLVTMRIYYPGYSMRLYTDLDLEQGSKYCQLICSNSDLFWCNVEDTPSHADLSEMVFRTWRFLPLGDPTVDVFLSRDLDSLISAREAAVVEDWLQEEEKAVSLMRDRKVGHDVPILAGMWQASNEMLGLTNASSIREQIISLSIVEEEQAYKSSDQKILSKVLFYPYADSIVAYDSYNCVKWGNFTEVRPYPTQRGDPNMDFVGNKVDFASGGGRFNYSSNECPEECRPEYGKDWTYC